MKKEIFDRIIEAVRPLYLADDTVIKNIKVVENDSFISYYFDQTTPKQKELLDHAMNLFKEHGWKHPPESEIYIQTAKYHFGCNQKMLCILYNKIKDSISISEFEYGYRYAHKKGRFFPYRANTPMLCYNKHIYTFIQSRRYKGVRIMKGGYLPHRYAETILKALLNINYKPTLDKVLTKNFINTKSEIEVIEKLYNVKIPKLLVQSFSATSLELLCKVLENPGEMNRICQFIIAKEKKVAEERVQKGVGNISFIDPAVSRSNPRYYGLARIIAEMCFNDSGGSWLVDDWLADHYELGEKLSLKITSEKRMQDEHNKLSRARILKGIKSIKMHSIYKGLFEGFPIPVEEINSKKRLLQESIEQEHCVATYANKINSGHCGIFSMVFNGTRYTLEVNKSLIMQQLQGFRNGKEGHNPPEELKNMITQHLTEHRIKLGVKAPDKEFLPF